METLGISNEEQSEIFACLSAVLHLSQVNWSNTKESSHLEWAAECLGVDAAELSSLHDTILQIRQQDLRYVSNF